MLLPSTARLAGGFCIAYGLYNLPELAFGGDRDGKMPLYLRAATGGVCALMCAAGVWILGGGVRHVARLNAYVSPLSAKAGTSAAAGANVGGTSTIGADAIRVHISARPPLILPRALIGTKDADVPLADVRLGAPPGEVMAEGVSAPASTPAGARAVAAEAALDRAEGAGNGECALNSL